MQIPYKYKDWPEYDSRDWKQSNEATIDGIWPYFGWSTPQLSQLIETLDTELKRRIIKFDEEKEKYPNDPDERSINRDWCLELTFTLRNWCNLLEINPEDLPGYRKASRQSVWNEDLIRTDTIPTRVLDLLRGRSGQDALVFRPACLERANEEIMKWLAAHPEDVDRVHHRTFEAIVAEAIRGNGWHVELTKRTRDGGYDILCLKNTTLNYPITMIVETKLYNLERSVGLPMVDRLMGVASRIQPQKAVIVTNSRFSNTVWSLWEKRVGRDLELIDREELLEWLRTGNSRV